MNEYTRADVKVLAHKLAPEAWLSYSGKTADQKRRIDQRRNEALEAAAQQLGFTSYLSAPTSLIEPANAGKEN